MKAKVKVEQWERQACTTTARQLTRMECGLAFAEFMLRAERIKDAKVTFIPKSDIVAGLQTAARMAGKRLVEGDFDPRARALLRNAFAGTTRVLNEVKKGPDKISLKAAAVLHGKVDGVSNILGDAWREIRSHCER